MNTNTISPLRRIAVTLVLTGVTALGAVSIAPAAFADESAPQTSVTQADPAADAPAADAPAADAPATDPAVVTPPAPPAPPAIVYDANGKPIKAPKICTAKDFQDVAKKVADATKKEAPVLQLAQKSHDAASALRAQEPKMTAFQVKLTELLANGLDAAGNKLEAQAQAVIDAAGQLTCIVVSVPSGRF